MKSLSLAAAVFTLVVPALSYSTTYRLTSDPAYDNGNTMTSTTACRTSLFEYKDFKSVPNFPYIGSIPHIGKREKYCGTCWELTYTLPNNKRAAVNITGVDAGHDEDTFSVSPAAYALITHGHPAKFVNVTAKKVNRKGCKFH